MAILQSNQQGLSLSDNFSQNLKLNYQVTTSSVPKDKHTVKVKSIKKLKKTS